MHRTRIETAPVDEALALPVRESVSRRLPGVPQAVSHSSLVLLILLTTAAAADRALAQAADRALAQDAPPETGGAGTPPLDDGLQGLLEGLDLELAPPTPSDSPEPSKSPATSGAGDDPQPDRKRSPAVAPAGPDNAGAGPLVEAYRSMQTANALLSQGETGEATLAAQRRAVDLLDQMIEAARQPQSAAAASAAGQASDADSQPGGGPGEQDSAEGSGPGEEGSPQQDSPQQGAGEQGSEQQPGGRAGQPGGPPTAAVPVGADEAAAARAAAAGTLRDGGDVSVWGHLPERTRGMLRAEVPTEYLPQYAEQISEYFRALAEMKPDE